MSTKPILIVESPSKARTISKYLGGDFEVLACVGHIKDLPPKDLGIDVDHDFEPTLKVLPDKRKFIKELKSRAKDASRIVIATDPDREGEAIADHLASEVPNDKLERVQFTEITKEGILDGMQHSRSIDRNLVNAQKTRRIIDRLVGYKLSPLLWRTLQKNMNFVKSSLSAGRVQSAAVKILVDRERMRAQFKQATYYDLKATLIAEKEPDTPVEATLIELDDKRIASGRDFDKNTGELKNEKVLPLSKAQATTLADEIREGPWIVSNIDEKPKTVKPRPPFTTSTLQQEAARKLRFAARRTMRLAQQLYEAGFITYMRTDSTTLSGEALAGARDQIQSRFGNDYLPEKPIAYRTKVKNAQEAHEAIRPAGRTFADGNIVARATNKDAARLYELIWKRTLASQMKPAKMKQTTVSIKNQKTLFRATGNVILFPGFMRVYVEGSDDPGAQLANREAVLPPLKPEEILTCNTLDVNEHQTQPPARFTEASLVKELEARGVGRPSTYASIIDTIQAREYVINRKGKLTPTFLAVAVTQLLENHFESLVDIDFTADMENRLDAISRGELQSVPFMNDFYFGNDHDPGLAELLEAEIDIRKACTIPLKSSGDKDEQGLEARVGRYGPYLQSGDKTHSIPVDLALGDLTLKKAEELLQKSEEGPDVLGSDPESDEPIYLKEGPYGPYVQLGDTKTRKSIPRNVDKNDVTLEMALQLLSLPKTLGKHPETGEPVTTDLGRYGPYVRSGNTNAKLPPSLSPLTVTLDEAVTLLKKRRKGSVDLRTVGAHPKTGETIVLKEGRYGPYATDGKVNASLPKGTDPETISDDEVIQLIDKKRAAGPRPKKRRKRKKS